MSDPGRQRPDNRERARETQGERREADGGIDRNRESRTRVEAEAVTGTGVKKLLGMRGRDKQAEKKVGAQQKQQGSLPARMGVEGLPSPLPGPDVDGGRRQLWVPGPTGKAAPTHPRSS